MNNYITDFINLNKIYWKSFNERHEPNTIGKLLVEPVQGCTFVANVGVISRIISKARKLQILWLSLSPDPYEQIALSFDSKAIIIKVQKLNFLQQFYIKLIYKYWLLLIKINKNNILKFKIDGVYFGDLLYDSYLYKNKLPTITSIDNSLIYILGKIIYNYFTFKKTIIKNNVSDVIITDGLGLISGILKRVSLKLNKNVFNIDFYRPIFVQNSLKDFKKNYRRPTSELLEYLLSLDKTIIKNDFNVFIHERLNAKHEDSFFAFEANMKIYESKLKFCEDYKLDFRKKNVFIMLHAFNDYPRMHFENMVFKDFYEWYIATLNFAQEHTEFNWIFKEHPARKYFRSEDVNMIEEVKLSIKAENIKFILYNEPFNSSSLCHIADVILTMGGTSGIEFSSWAKIPIILAAETYYSGFGFTHDAKDKTDYFRILENIEKITKLTDAQQYLAQVIFLYIYKYSFIEFPWIEKLNRSELVASQEILDSSYWNRLNKRYSFNRENIKDTFFKVMDEIKSESFEYQAISLPNKNL